MDAGLAETGMADPINNANIAMTNSSV